MGSSTAKALSNIAVAFISSTGGVVGTNDYLVQAQGSPNNTVLIGVGAGIARAYVPNAAGDMMYSTKLDATQNVTIAANASGNPRIDSIVLYIDLSASPTSTADNVAKFYDVQGTPAGSPSAPNSAAILSAIGASNPYIVLANIAVANGFTSINSGNITDGRTFASFGTKATKSQVAAGTDDIGYITSLGASIYANNSLYRQALINGNFVVNQRVYVSGAVLAAGVYGHDRFKAGASGGDYTFTQLASSTQITIATGKSLIQVVEDKNVVGGTYTLSWTGTAQARYAINSATPAGAYAASPIAIIGQTAGTVMSVEFNTGTLSNVQLNSGTVALPFMPKSFEDELRTCQRYFEKSYDQATAPGTATQAAGLNYTIGGTTTLTSTTTTFKTRKRTIPTITLYAYDGTSGAITTYGAGNVLGCTVDVIGENNFGAIIKSAGITIGSLYQFHWVAIAEL